MDPFTTVRWPDEVEGIVGGELTVAIGQPTPKGWRSLATVTTPGWVPRGRTVTFTTSLGFGRKLERIVADPRIAVVHHTRQDYHSSQATSLCRAGGHQAGPTRGRR